jgi:pantoate--beta-alanine ligase
MKVFSTTDKIKSAILKARKDGLSIGLVPTMGALHEGHLTLLQRSLDENDISVCSIFVNPIQFNNSKDLEKYPRSLDADLEKLESEGCDMVFTPDVDEMYPEGEVNEKYDFGHLERVMEGKYRPGHFNGVATVVKRLFEICTPHRAYFGEKDFQQLMIIRALVEMHDMDVDVVACPIIREKDGLAMSSRNARLSDSERETAPEIYRVLKWIRDESGKHAISHVLDYARRRLNSLPGMKVEYLVIVNEVTLIPVKSWHGARKMRVFVAVHLGDVRLIDNLGIR